MDSLLLVIAYDCHPVAENVVQITNDSQSGVFDPGDMCLNICRRTASNFFRRPLRKRFKSKEGLHSGAEVHDGRTAQFKQWDTNG